MSYDPVCACGHRAVLHGCNPLDPDAPAEGDGCDGHVPGKHYCGCALTVQDVARRVALLEAADLCDRFAIVRSTCDNAAAELRRMAKEAK